MTGESLVGRRVRVSGVACLLRGDHVGVQGPLGHCPTASMRPKDVLRTLAVPLPEVCRERKSTFLQCQATHSVANRVASGAFPLPEALPDDFVVA